MPDEEYDFIAEQEDKKETVNVYDNEGTALPDISTPLKTSPLEIKKSGPVNVDTLSKLIDVVGVSFGKKASLRAFYKDAKMTVPSHYYEEDSKRFGFSKGYTTINLSYTPFSEKDLFTIYDEYVGIQRSLKQQGKEVEILPFAYWADNHFRQTTPPAYWKEEFKQNWPVIQNIYNQSNLITLNPERRKIHEIKIDNGLCYLRNPRLQSGKIDDQNWVLLDYSQKIKVNHRGDALIYVLAEDQKGQKHLFYAVDLPGIFHHSSFNDGSLSILAAGTMTVKNGVITKITDDSGHYRPNSINFENMIDYLENQKAINDKTEISYHTKQLVSSHFSLYLVSKFDPEKCEMKGNAIILDNKNNVYFVKDSKLILQFNKEKHETPQVEKITDRHGIQFSDSKEPKPATSPPEALKKVIHEAVIKGLHFSININSKNLTPEQVNDLRLRVKARKKWEFLANSVTSNAKDLKPEIQRQLPPSGSHTSSSFFPISSHSKGVDKSPKQEPKKENTRLEMGLS